MLSLGRRRNLRYYCRIALGFDEKPSRFHDIAKRRAGPSTPTDQEAKYFLWRCHATSLVYSASIHQPVRPTWERVHLFVPPCYEEGAENKKSRKKSRQGLKRLPGQSQKGRLLQRPGKRAQQCQGAGGPERRCRWATSEVNEHRCLKTPPKRSRAMTFNSNAKGLGAYAPLPM